MPKSFVIEAKDMAGGISLSKGEKNVKPNENIESRNMRMTPSGGVVTNLGYVQPSGQSWGETGEGMDGLYVMGNYPGILWGAVNGKIKYTVGDNATAYEADPANVLTKDYPVLMREYRGMLYYCNGYENAGRYAVGRLASQITVASTTVPLSSAEGYRFNNAADKVYCEGDEIDYTAVSSSGVGDNLTTASNISATHDAGAYVTQYNALTAPPSGSLKFKTFAFFRDTMFVGGILDEPNLLRYGKTISSVGSLISGDIHDFSDGNNYIMGEGGGTITALQATRDRLYVGMTDRIYYIGIEMNSSGTEVFSPDRLFSNNYGVANQFCMTEMEDAIVFFSGKRVIRVSYQANSQQILPEDQFDNDIYPLLASCDADQSDARVFYNPVEKKLRVSFKSGGLLLTAVYDNRMKKWSFPDTEDPAVWVSFQNKTYFGDRDQCKVYKYGSDLNANGLEIAHVYKTGRLDAGSRATKRFISGQIEGYIAVGTTINFTVFINGQVLGGVRQITSDMATIGDSGAEIGNFLVGSDAVGDGGGATLLYPFRYPYLISSIGEDVQLKFSSLGDGSAWEIDKYRIEGVVYDEIPYKHY